MSDVATARNLIDKMNAQFAKEAAMTEAQLDRLDDSGQETWSDMLRQYRRFSREHGQRCTTRSIDRAAGTIQRCRCFNDLPGIVTSVNPDGNRAQF